jgi:adenylate cyclase
MDKDQLSRKLAVILHADVVDSTALVRQNETLAHQRIQEAFRRFSETIINYGGVAHEIRGDALVAEFSRASDAVAASVEFQTTNAKHTHKLPDKVRPVIRIGIAMGEVVVADDTVTGEGVVLAQRLEQLSEPGDVVVQGAVSEIVPTRLPFAFESLGEHIVKGFEKPVRAFAVRLEAGAEIPRPDPNYQRRTDVESGAYKPTLDTPDHPSIAVLPFTNMSGDPEQEYFSDGITEDIITALSRISGLLVIARNSTMFYKGQAVDVRKVGQEQGVRYVLEGSVRKGGNRVRITAQLVDTSSGEHLWADRYDRHLTDVFAVQDEITQKITLEMRVKLSDGEQARMWMGGTHAVDAWEKVFRANELKDREIFEDNLEGRRLSEEALKIDPNYASVEVARKAVKLTPNHSENTAMFAVLLTCAGKTEEAVEKFKRAIRLSPKFPAWYLVLLGACYYSMGDQEKAIETLREAVAMEPESAFARVWLACALVEAEQEEEANLVAREVMRIDPNFTASDYQGAEFKDQEIGERVVQNLLCAGFPR